MALRSKIVLKRSLSRETMDAVRTYLSRFLDRRHTIEHFDGQVSIYLHDRNDVGVLRQHFSSVIAGVQDLH